MKTKLALLVLVASLQVCTSNKRCPPDFCNNKDLNCSSVICPTDHKLIRRGPEIYEGDNCEDIQRNRCVEGLKCVNSVCTKE
nr:unnamed protein product [Callosobruchus analis]